MSDISKRPERLASAIYLVTGFFNDLEPIKWKLRSLASDFVSIGMSIKDESVSNRPQTIFDIRAVMLEIVSLLNVAKNAGLVSDMNHRILHDEFEKFLNMVGFPPGIGDVNGRAVLAPDFFGSHEVEKIEERPSEVPKLADIKDRIDEEKKAESRPSNIGHQTATQRQNAHEYLPQVDNGSMANQAEKSEERSLKEFGAVSVKKSSRQSIIINLLKRKKEIMIKDVSPLIRGCSEKTIQRELSRMVQDGILKKQGEKRWSRYSLAEGQK